jgi:leader peptidase (prepilin peptidase) / N-methyltransferase
VATFCDFDVQAIPLPLTLSGTVVGLIGSVLFAWPWPYTPAEALGGIPPGQPWWIADPRAGPRPGLYPWPVWGPLPDWLQPGGNWQTGLATGLAGALAGTLLLRAVRLFFGLGVGADYMEPSDPDADQHPVWFARRWLSWVQRVGGRALGLGDADLMMMAGAFLGWQPIVIAFFVGVFPGLIFGVVQWAMRGNHPMPFGPSLAIGVVLTLLGWHAIGPHYQVFFFNAFFVGAIAGFGCIGMLLAAYVLRMLRLLRE